MCSHSVGVGIYSLALAHQLKLPRAEVVKIGLAAMLHDIGKAKVDKDILLKQGTLNAVEFLEVKKHSNYGYQILQFHNETAQEVLDGVLYHHEKYNGEGYLEGLKGNSIPDPLK